MIYWDAQYAPDHSHAKPGIPTPTNNGWYRLYSSGWVEQGGYFAAIDTYAANRTITLFIPMRDINYHKSKTIHGGVSTGSNFSWRAVADSESAACDSYDTTTTSNFHITSTNISLGAYWKVYGYAA